MKYYFYNIFERNGNYEYNHKGLEILSKDEDPSKHFEEKAQGFYSEGDKEVIGGKTFYWHFGELVTQLHDFKEVTKEEYDLLTKFI